MMMKEIRSGEMEKKHLSALGLEVCLQVVVQVLEVPRELGLCSQGLVLGAVRDWVLRKWSKKLFWIWIGVSSIWTEVLSLLRGVSGVGFLGIVLGVQSLLHEVDGVVGVCIGGVLDEEVGKDSEGKDSEEIIEITICSEKAEVLDLCRRVLVEIPWRVVVLRVGIITLEVILILTRS
jgi:hypothetical protein